MPSVSTGTLTGISSKGGFLDELNDKLRLEGVRKARVENRSEQEGRGKRAFQQEGARCTEPKMLYLVNNSRIGFTALSVYDRLHIHGWPFQNICLLASPSMGKVSN